MAYNTSGTKEGDFMDVEITMEKLGRVFNTVMYKSEADYINMVVIDITDLKETESKLSKAIEDANAAYKTQAEFLANMSHEIRTPINAVVGMNEMILRESKDKNVLEYASNIQSASRNLLNIINDILDFSKIESGKMEIYEHKYNLGELLDDVITMIEIRAQKKGLAFELFVEETLPEA